MESGGAEVGGRTVELSSVGGDRRRRDRQALPALTVLYHPRVERVGERLLLTELAGGKAVWLSRGEPDFVAPGHGAPNPPAPLADPYLSRSPMLLAPGAEGGVRWVLNSSPTPVEIDGEPVAGQRELPVGALRRGVVITLAGRVVLLLHLCSGGGADAACRRHGLLGESDAMVAACREIQRVGDLDVAVLLRGPTGTGKELMARALHEASPRRHGPFVSVNLAAVPASLAASELFGAVKGAFTGSVRTQPGFFQRAQGGTLFLDEVGDAPPEVQAALLRVLETGEVQRVGAQQPLTVDVRLIAATDLDLERAAEEGDFRGPLLHRLAGYEVTLPSLSQRRDDVGRLLVHFLTQELRQLGEGRRLVLPDPAADPWLPASIVARLARHPWPGNVRQLRNVARQLAVAGRGAERARITANVERVLREAEGGVVAGGEPVATPTGERRGQDVRLPDADGSGSAASGGAAAAPASYRSPGDVEDEELVATLRAHQWKVKPTARVLGVSRSSLYNLMERSPRVRKAIDLSDDEVAAARHRHGGDLDAMTHDLEVSRAALEQRLQQLSTDGPAPVKGES